MTDLVILYASVARYRCLTKQAVSFKTQNLTHSLAHSLFLSLHTHIHTYTNKYTYYLEPPELGMPTSHQQGLSWETKGHCISKLELHEVHFAYK